MYDFFGLTGINQARTFIYDSNERLQSETRPERGATSYTYNADGTRATSTDAKNQVVEYVYDNYRRTSEIKKYSSPGVEAVCEKTLLYYDTNPFDGSDTSGNRWGRMSARQWFVPTDSGCTTGYRFTELYSYTQGGKATIKRLYLKSDTTWPTFTTVLGQYREVTYSYDLKGLLYSIKYPDSTTYSIQRDLMYRPIQLNNVPNDPLIKDVTYNPGGQITCLN